MYAHLTRPHAHVHYTFTCMCLYIHIHVHVHSIMYINLHMHVYMYVYTYTCTCSNSQTSTHNSYPIPQTGSSIVDSGESHHFPFHSVPHHQTTTATPISSSPHNRSLPQPIGHPPERTGSSMSEGVFQKAPGAEVKSRSFEEDGQVCCVCVPFI